MILVAALCVILLGNAVSGLFSESKIIYNQGVIFQDLGRVSFGDSSWTMITSVDLTGAAPILKKLYR